MLCLFGVQLCVCEGAKYLVGQTLCYCCHGSHVRAHNDVRTCFSQIRIYRLHYLLLAAVMWQLSPTDMLCGYCPQQICYVATVPNRYVVATVPNRYVVATVPNKYVVATVPNRYVVATVPNRYVVATVPNKYSMYGPGNIIPCDACDI